MSHSYNAYLQYDDKRMDILVTKIEWGWGSAISSSQNRQGKTTYPLGWHSQNNLQVTGQCYSPEEHASLVKYLRDWHSYATSRPRPSFIRFRYPTRGIDYLVFPPSVQHPIGIKDVAPVWSYPFDIVRDMLDVGSGAVSHTVGKWWWEPGYTGELEDVSDVEGTSFSDPMSSSDPDDAFRGGGF